MSMAQHVTQTSYRVGMMDVDLVQIHFASYLPWVDDAFSALLEDLAHPLQDLLATGWGTPVVDLHCSYRSPVGLGDRLATSTWVERAGSSSFVVRHEFRCEERVVAVIDVTHVWITTGEGSPAPRPVPAWLLEAARTTARPASTDA
jgi:YbgC/YbaW family acyl-CoA thioester hydrolase